MNALRALKRLVRSVARPITRTSLFRRLLGRLAITRAGRPASHNAYDLLYTGNLFLLARKHNEALKFYIAACEVAPETRWVSGKSFLDYVDADRSRFKNDLGPLKTILGSPEYAVPDLELALFNAAMAGNPEPVEALIASTPLERLSEYVTVRLGSKALEIGRNDIAIKAYRHALQRKPDDVALRQQLGVAEFLTRFYSQAEASFATADHLKQLESMRWNAGDVPFRVLDKSWTPAIGHVAFLDTYIKSMHLGWLPNKPALLVYDQARPPAGWPMFKFFSQHVTIVPTHLKIDDKIDLMMFGEGATDLEETCRNSRRASVSHSFWYGPDGDGKIQWYGPLGAAVEAAWKAEQRPALFSLSEEERKVFRKRMAQVYGLPEDAWYVLLHVREPGFHSGWHKYHAGTRNADIHSYQSIVDFVIGQGGWVVRGGDPSMIPYSPHPRVIDYATNVNRSPEIDIYLCADCAYFVGTNSGFSVVPPIFGKRCALTNWSPIGIPNWYLDDIFIPKLVRKKSENRYLTFQEMYDSFTGWSQFARDFENSDFVVEDNEADDLLEAVEELHAEVFGTASDPAPEDQRRLERFNEVCLAHGSYLGSRMGCRFLKKYQQLLDDPRPDSGVEAPALSIAPGPRPAAESSAGFA
jgi:putative glycosyltransferase (TIGR04372 family)